MCGIAGFNFGNEDLIKLMNRSLAHRGPNGNSIYVENGLSLGHARLSIIDLSDAGRQPMFYKARGRSVCIVFNGEIYNYIELKQKLVKLGYIFYTNTDTEVILASYIEWGENCVTEFNGMWAFSLYDIDKQLLFCSRDRLGVKPFHYFNENGKFIFSSEIKAILQHTELHINRVTNVDSRSVELFFSLGYIPAPYTIYKNISKLPAGNNLIFDLTRSTIINIYSYYTIPSVEQQTCRQELLREGKEILRDAVKLRMRSDVPIGAFLSGGLDSSTVVGEMKHFTDADSLHSFSIGFEEKLYDESKYINLVKDYFKTRHHHHIYIEEDFKSMWGKYASVFDEPFGDYSSFPSFKVCKMASEQVTVVLSGDGGDEIFGGYPTYNTGYIIDKIMMLPKSVRKLLYHSSSIIKGLDKKLGKVNETFRLALQEKEHFHAKLFSDNRYKPEIYTEWTTKHLSDALLISKNNLSEALRVYDLITNTLPDNYLVKVDRTSMSNSIEVRSPFLDYRFIEFAEKIPPDLKVTFSNNKILMRELIKEIVPKEILYRSKMGFTPPINKWLYNSIDKDTFEKYCGYTKQYSEELFLFYQKIIHADDNSYMKDFYMMKLAIFGNWVEKWICSSE